MVQLRHLPAHTRGQRVAGPSGRQYYVHPETGFLHMVDREGVGHSEKPGVLVEDAKEFQQFRTLYVNVEAPPAERTLTRRERERGGSTQPIQPGTGAASAGAGEPEGPSKGIAPAVSAPLTFEGPSVAALLPADHNALTNAGWLELAARYGVDLNGRERSLPKLKLAGLIAERAALIPASEDALTAPQGAHPEGVKLDQSAVGNEAPIIPPAPELPVAGEVNSEG